MSPFPLPFIVLTLSLGALVAGFLSMVGGSRPGHGPFTMDPNAYPATRSVDVVDGYHGTLVADPYRWLDDRPATTSATASRTRRRS